MGLLTRTRQAIQRPEYQFGPPRSGIQPTEYRHSRPVTRDVAEFSGFVIPLRPRQTNLTGSHNVFHLTRIVSSLGCDCLNLTHLVGGIS